MTKKITALVVLLVVLGGLAAAYFVGGEDLMGRMSRFSGGKGTITEREDSSDGKGTSDNITKGEMMRYVVVFPGWAITYGAQPTFPDVPMSHTYYKYVETAYANDLIDGYANGTFGPEDYVSKAEAAKLYVTSFELPLCPTSSGNPSFADVSQDAWYFDYVETLVAYGMGEDLLGSPNFEPGVNITKTDAIAWGKFLKDVDGEPSCGEVDVCPEVVESTESYSKFIVGAEQTVGVFDIIAMDEDLEIDEIEIKCSGVYTENTGFDDNYMKLYVNGDLLAGKSTAQDPCTEGTTFDVELANPPLEIPAGDDLTLEIVYDTAVTSGAAFGEFFGMEISQLNGVGGTNAANFTCDYVDIFGSVMTY
jgi:hypothetical protein